ncbi:MAG: hypothetical protein K0Q76_1576 [Panacagrimonas sp.]|jgi:hypothetical protein|nr:post-COAP-1 domain-containing protein [Panacagrimonas sp.]MCC2656468.1 hypothetical protein [Panacagrimonas sp.]
MSVATTSRHTTRWWTAALTTATVLLASTSAVQATYPESPPPPAPDCGTTGAANSHAARAYSLKLAASVLGIDIGIPGSPAGAGVPDTGELPSTGGSNDATLVAISGVDLPIPLPKQLSLGAKILHNTTFGSGNTSGAYSSVADLNLAINNGLTNLLSVSASALNAYSTVKCVNKTRTVDAGRTGSKIAKLVIKVLGVPIVIPAQAPANTKIALPLALKLLAKGSIVLNEQVTSNGRQVVNAVHVNLEVLGLLNAAKIDLIISHAEANTTCGSGGDPDSCTCKFRDFVTGGGQFPANGGSVSFSVNGRAEGSNGPKGRLNIVDHTTRRHIKGDTMHDYQILGDQARALSYHCSDNTSGAIGVCQAFVQDNATSGGGSDLFGLYSAQEGQVYPTVPLLHGNIMLHKPNCGAGGGGGGGTSPPKPPKGPKPK